VFFTGLLYNLPHGQQQIDRILRENRKLLEIDGAIIGRYAVTKRPPS